MKLTTIHKDRACAVYITTDFLFEMIGRDLNCTGAAARAAGAGPVWSFRPACGKGTSFDDAEQHFASRAACEAALELAHAARLHAAGATAGAVCPNPPAVFVACSCGASNRVCIDGRRYRCGKCRHEFSEADLTAAIGGQQ